MMILVFLPSAGLYAQTTSDPASREDLQKATAEMKRAVRDAEKKSATQAAKARTEAEKQHQESLQQSVEVEKKLRDEIITTAAKQQKVAEETEAKTRKMMFWGVGGVVAVLALIALGVVFARSRTKAPEVRVVQNHGKKTDILTDPDIPALKEFAARNGNISRVMFCLTLSQKGTLWDGEQIICTAELRENLPPLVYFDGDASPVAWDKRKRRAVLIAMQKQSAVVGSVTQ